VRHALFVVSPIASGILFPPGAASSANPRASSPSRCSPVALARCRVHPPSDQGLKGEIAILQIWPWWESRASGDMLSRCVRALIRMLPLAAVLMVPSPCRIRILPVCSLQMPAAGQNRPPEPSWPSTRTSSVFVGSCGGSRPGVSHACTAPRWTERTAGLPACCVAYQSRKRSYIGAEAMTRFSCRSIVLNSSHGSRRVASVNPWLRSART
jgi:hypothetical protein